MSNIVAMSNGDYLVPYNSSNTNYYTVSAGTPIADEITDWLIEGIPHSWIIEWIKKDEPNTQFFPEQKKFRLKQDSTWSCHEV